MARLSQNLLSFWNQLVFSFTKDTSESAWDNYRTARAMAKHPVVANK